MTQPHVEEDEHYIEDINLIHAKLDEIQRKYNNLLKFLQLYIDGDDKDVLLAEPNEFKIVYEE